MYSLAAVSLFNVIEKCKSPDTPAASCDRSLKNFRLVSPALHLSLKTFAGQFSRDQFCLESYNWELRDQWLSNFRLESLAWELRFGNLGLKRFDREH